MDVKHTPAPWKQSLQSSGLRRINQWKDGVEWQGIAFTVGLGDPTDEANAHLIAAAPTMYDALISIRSQCMGHADEFSQRVWEISNRAIALAEGRAVAEREEAK